jgi:carbon-monoxide dehydrogenase medium subunit
MKPAVFELHEPRSLDEALSLKARHGDAARFLAGGQSLVPAMNLRLAEPAILIDINRLPGLDGIGVGEQGELSAGALVRHRAIEHSALVRARQPLIAEAMPHVAHPPIRNRGTLCGNLANADPASEMPAVMLALGARFHLASARGPRLVTARDFFVNVYTTALSEDEMLCGIEVPALPARSGTAFQEVARRHGDFALMGVAAHLVLDEEGVCRQASLACCNAGATPMACDAAAGMLIGASPDAQALEAVAAAVPAEIDPGGNVHASAGFQRHLARILARRVLETAARRARGDVA